jgi:hypothetical protein
MRALFDQVGRWIGRRPACARPAPDVEIEPRRRPDAPHLEINHGQLAALQESEHFWRHVANELAGHDRARREAAEDVVYRAFMEAGAQRIGPKLPRKRG